MYMYVHINTSTLFKQICIWPHAFTKRYAYTRTRTLVCVYIYKFIHVCIYTSVYLHMYICIHVEKYILTLSCRVNSRYGHVFFFIAKCNHQNIYTCTCLHACVLSYIEWQNICMHVCMLICMCVYTRPRIYTHAHKYIPTDLDICVLV